MKIGIPAERRLGEKRVAPTLETVKRLTAQGRDAVLLQAGAAVGASVPDDHYPRSHQ